MKSLISAWYQREIDGAPMSPVEIDGMRHFCAGSEILPGSLLLCGQVVDRKQWSGSNDGEVSVTCPKCGPLAAQIRMPTDMITDPKVDVGDFVADPAAEVSDGALG